MSVYIHIPFCSYICSYCDFSKVLINGSVDMYLSMLEEEIRSVYRNDLVDTIYIGGGTPSSLSYWNLKRLFEIVKVFKVSSSVEFTIEVNPDITRDKIDLFLEYGVNRVSIGVQTFSESSLSVLGRSHNKDMVFSVVDYIKSKGIGNISIDLIYGIPNTCISDVLYDLSCFFELDIPHISYYNLIVEPNTLFYINNVSNDDEMDFNMYSCIVDALSSYNHYEVSNFCRKGYQSIHNMVYWNNMEYYGFGLGAHSFVGGVRYENTRSMTSYLKGYNVLNSEVMSRDVMMSNEMILGLRKIEGVNRSVFFNKYGVCIEDVFDVSSLSVSDDFVFIPKDKLFISNDILVNFL